METCRGLTHKPRFTFEDQARDGNPHTENGNDFPAQSGPAAVILIGWQAQGIGAVRP